MGQRIGGSLGAAVLAVVLQQHLRDAGSLGQVADSFGAAFWWVLGIGVSATLPAFYLAVAEGRSAASTVPVREVAFRK
ncbi:hypothetical protein ACFZB5_34930 [Streptomyces nodosus]|uniref:hypothetical protein n=2 Tax=Streptomyces TaxID=1883 RepID=UPI0036E493B5